MISSGRWSSEGRCEHSDASARAQRLLQVPRFAVFDPFMPMPGVTFLQCEHTDLPDTETAAHLEVGWVAILSGLKTLLETGAPLSGPPA